MDSPKSYQGTPYLCRHTYYTELNEKRRRERQMKKAAGSANVAATAKTVVERAKVAATAQVSAERAKVVADAQTVAERAKAKTTAEPAAKGEPVSTAFAQANATPEQPPWYAGIRARLRDNKRIDAAISRVVAWLEIDDKSCRVERKAKRLPVGVMAAMLCLALSLMLIVAGAVISSKANMELYDAENRLASLKSTEAELSRRLELKNDLRYIEEEARGRLGMIDREHASVLTVDDKREDKVEIYRPGGGRTAISALLNALGFFGE